MPTKSKPASAGTLTGRRAVASGRPQHSPRFLEKRLPLFVSEPPRIRFLTRTASTENVTWVIGLAEGTLWLSTDDLLNYARFRAAARRWLGVIYKARLPRHAWSEEIEAALARLRAMVGDVR